MGKKVGVIVSILLILATVLSAAYSGFYWARQSEGTTLQPFAYPEEYIPNPNNWAVFATGGNDSNNPAGEYDFSGQGQGGGIHQHSENDGGKVGTNAKAKIPGHPRDRAPVRLGNDNATITPASNFYFGFGTGDKGDLVSGPGQGQGQGQPHQQAIEFASNAKINTAYQTFDTTFSWRDFSAPSYKNLFDQYHAIPPSLGTGYYPNLRIESGETRNITVNDDDIIILADTLFIHNNGKLSITRNGNGRLFILVTTSITSQSGGGTISIATNGATLSYDNRSFLFYNGTDGFPNNRTFNLNFPGIIYLYANDFYFDSNIGGVVSRGQKIRSSGNSTIDSLVYAPLADFDFRGNASINGGTVIAKNIELNGNGGIQYKLMPIPLPRIPDPKQQIPTEWAVFSIGGRIELTGSSSIVSHNPSNILGGIGTNASGFMNNEYPITLGQGPESVITPCSNVFFGPNAIRAEMVGHINYGEEAQARRACLRDNAGINPNIEMFFVPSWLNFETPGELQLPNRGTFSAGWSGGPFAMDHSDSGYYDLFEVISNLTIRVYDDDIIIHTNKLRVTGTSSPPDIRVERHGSGRVFILVNSELELIQNARIYSYDSSGSQIPYDENLFLFYNGTSSLMGVPQFEFSGLFYVKQANIQIGGSTRVTGLVSLHDTVTVSGAGFASQFVYAPNAAITIENGAEIHGVVIGNSLHLLGDGLIRYRIVAIPIPEIPEYTGSIGSVALVAAGLSGIYTSDDGENWTKRQVQGWVPWHTRAISSNDQGYVILGAWSGGGLINSVDGISWISSQLTGSSVYDVIWANNMYVAVGEWGREAIRWSYDGLTWHHRSSHSGGDLYGVAWGNGRFVAVGDYGSGGAYWSTNGTDWNSVTTSGNVFRSVAFGNGHFIKVGDGRIRYSTNGITWENTHEYSSSDRNLNKIVWNGNLFVAVGPNGRILISPTGITGGSWSQVSSGTSRELKDVTWSSGLGAFFVVGNDVILKSTNGINWDVITPIDTETGASLSLDLEAVR